MKEMAGSTCMFLKALAIPFFDRSTGGLVQRICLTKSSTDRNYKENRDPINHW